MESNVADNLRAVRAQVNELAVSSGRNPEDVTLIAVSKTKPVSAIRAAYEAGQRHFGENRIQELEEKVPQLPSDINWHLIGHLQSNKAGKAVNLATSIHSMDSEKLVRRVDRLAGENGRRPEILLEVNAGCEASKYGFRPELDELRSAAELAMGCVNLNLTGLMTMAPFGSPDDELRRIFSNLRELRDQLRSELHADLPQISMGMSSDYHVAIPEGATYVRVGTAIFGERDYA